MIKLIVLPIVKTLRRFILMAEDQVYNIDFPVGISIDKYDNLFIGAEEIKEKIPTMVQLRVHTLKGGEKNEKK